MRLVDADIFEKKYIEHIRQYGKNDLMDEYSNVMCILNSVPVVEQPSLVHCSECEWWTESQYGLQGHCDLMNISPAGSWYCANAERKTDNEVIDDDTQTMGK